MSLYPPHFQRPCYFKLADYLSIWFFFSFATLKFNFGENVCTCQRICIALLTICFHGKRIYELSPIFYGQETNYVFLPNCYYVSMTLWLKTFWNLIFENLSLKCDAIHESFIDFETSRILFLKVIFWGCKKNVMLDKNWDTHNRNIPIYIFFFFLNFPLFCIYCGSGLGNT